MVETLTQDEDKKGEAAMKCRVHLEDCLRLIGHFLAAPFQHRESILAGKVSEELKWFDEFQPKNGVDYSPVIKLGADAYKDLKEAVETLDKKAEWLFATSTIMVAAIYAIYQLSPFRMLAGLPAMACLLWSQISIIRARMPGERTSFMTVRDAIRCAEATDKPEPLMCGSLHCTIEGMRVVAAWKAWQLKNASIAIMGGLFLMAILFICPIPKQESPPNRLVSDQRLPSQHSDAASEARPQPPSAAPRRQLEQARSAIELVQ